MKITVQHIEYGREEGGITAQLWLGMAEYGGQLSVVQYGSVGQSHECVCMRAMAKYDKGNNDHKSQAGMATLCSSYMTRPWRKQRLLTAYSSERKNSEQDRI